MRPAVNMCLQIALEDYAWVNSCCRSCTAVFTGSVAVTRPFVSDVTLVCSNRAPDTCWGVDCGHGSCSGGTCRYDAGYSGTQCENSRPLFVVQSGPCRASTDDAGCVGRANGYDRNEDCEIIVEGSGGTIQSCSVFALNGRGSPATGDYVLIPGAAGDCGFGDSGTSCGGKYDGHRCPVGVQLASGQSFSFHSDNEAQGYYNNGRNIFWNGVVPSPDYAAHGGLGGGWEICF